MGVIVSFPLTPCGHFAITDTLIIRRATKPPAIPFTSFVSYYILHYASEKFLHFALNTLLHFASMSVHVALLLHFSAILITFCVSITFCGVTRVIVI